MSTTPVSQRARSTDGTLIAFARSGDGPPLILIEAAGHYREFTSFSGLIPLLAAEFAVITYDRRGRAGAPTLPPTRPSARSRISRR